MKETAHETGASFGAWVRQRRRVLDLTQARLADLSACTESTVRKIEADERRPSRRAAERLARALRVPEDERVRFVEAARGEHRVDRLRDSGPAGADVALGNLTQPAGELIGREAELALIAQRLADGACRLLTVTGPGGIGKTRLTLAAAARAQALFPDGVWLVQLAAVESQDILLSAIAQALGVTLSSETDAHTQLRGYLRDRCLLLVLDNFEHLLPATQAIAGLLDAAARIKLLVTSRERLNLSDEWLLPLAGLPIDTSDAMLDTASAAVRLFEARAARVRPGFAATDDELQEIAHICRIVEGAPLAIELAAAWTHLLPCSQIRHEIERNLDFLRSSARDVPARHSSLRAAFDHSVSLLTPQERASFARLSVFRAGFDRQAAHKVADADLAELAALADKSLLRQAGDGQLAMHELLRQFAAELLARDADDHTRVHAAHGRYFLELAAGEHDALVSTRATQAVARLAPLLPDVRAAIQWALSVGELERLNQALASLYWMYELSGRFGEAIELVDMVCNRAAAHANAASKSGAALISLTYGVSSWLLLQVGRYPESLQSSRSTVALLRLQEHSFELPLSLATLAIAAAYVGDRAQAQSTLDEMQSIAIPEGRPGWLGQLRLAAALAYNALGAIDEAERELHRAREALLPFGQPWMLGSVYFHLSNLAIRRERLDEAQQHAQHAVQTWQALGERHPALVLADATLGRVALKRGDLGAARVHCQRSLDRSESLGYTPYIAHALANLGRVNAAEGHHEAALRLHEEALQVSRELHNLLSIVRSLLHCADALAHLGRAAQAYRDWREAAELALDAGLHEQARQAIGAMAAVTRTPAVPAEDVSGLRKVLDSLPAAIANPTPQQP